MLGYTEFAKKIKTKYPEYREVDDLELSKLVVEKYPEYKDKVVFEEELDEEVVEPRIQESRDFEDTTLGKIANFPSMLLGQPKLSEMMERSAELKELPLSERVKESAKDIGTDVLKAAPMLVGGPVAKGGVQLAKGVLPRLIQLTKEGSKLGAVTGSAKTGEELLEGKDIQEAAKTGLQSGALTAGTSAAIPAISEGATSLIGSLAKGAMKIKPWALKVAEKDPDILAGREPKVFDITLKVKDNLQKYSDKIQDSYNNKLSKLRYPEGNVIKTDKITEKIKALNIPKTVLKTTLNKEAARQFEDISPKTINKFLSGKNINFEEAQQLNSFLSKTVKSQATESLGTGGIGKIKSIKSALLDSMEKPVINGSQTLYKPVRTINKNYSKRLEKFKALEKNLGTEQVAESRLRQVGEELAGVSRNKTALANKLRELDRVVDKEDRVAKQLVRSTAADEFEKRFETARLGQLLTAGTGFYLGKQATPDDPMTGGVLGGLAGASLGQKAPLRFMTRGIGQADKLATRFKGVPTALGRMAGAAVGRGVESSKYEPSGNLTPEFTNKLRNQRRIN